MADAKLRLPGHDLLLRAEGVARVAPKLSQHNCHWQLPARMGVWHLDVSQNWGYLLGGHYNKDDNILGPISLVLGNYHFGFRAWKHCESIWHGIMFLHHLPQVME